MASVIKHNFMTVNETEKLSLNPHSHIDSMLLLTVDTILSLTIDLYFH